MRCETSAGDANTRVNRVLACTDGCRYWPTIVGGLVFLFGIIFLGVYEDREDQFCTSNYTLCAECETCLPVELKTQCIPYQVSRVFDNYLTALFGLFMAVWSSTFLDFWKRTCSHYVFRWAVPDDHELNRTRPEFVGRREWFDQYIGRFSKSDLSRMKPFVQLNANDDDAEQCPHEYECKLCASIVLCGAAIPRTATVCTRHRCRTVGCRDKVVGISLGTCTDCADKLARGEAITPVMNQNATPRSTLKGVFTRYLSQPSSIGVGAGAKALGVDETVGSLTCARHVKEAKCKRAGKVISSFSVTVSFVLLAIATMFAIAIYRLAVRVAIGRESGDEIKPYANLIGMVTASLLDLIAISILNPIYRIIAKYLADWENHRTVEAYEASLTIKIFSFEFVNTNSAIFYIAFFKGTMDSYPGNYYYYGDGDIRDQPCQAYGCNLDLTIQIFVVMLGKQTIQNFIETYLPQLIRTANGECPSLSQLCFQMI